VTPPMSSGGGGNGRSGTGGTTGRPAGGEGRAVPKRGVASRGSGWIPTPRPGVPPQAEEDPAERTRQRISSSPLKRIEGEEKEIQRRNQPVHIGLRLTVMGVVVLGLFSMMIVRLWSLQVLQGPAARSYELSLSTRTIAISPTRGLILSRDGSVLVANKIMSVVTLSRQQAVNDPAVIQRLAVSLGISTSEIRADLNDQQDSLYEPVPVAIGVSDSTILELSEHRAEFPGVTVNYVAERTYPEGDLGAQMLGYVSDITSAQLKALAKHGYLASDVIGQSGIEAEYEHWLRGKSGKQVLEIDALGETVGTESQTAPVPGDDVVLNIDAGLEAALQQALAHQIATLHNSGLPANSGAAVVIDPQDGAVLAMVSSPTYDPEWWVGGMSTAHYADLTRPSSLYPLLNRTVQGLYQPGSTFKLATATAALNDGLISPYTPITDPGSFTIPNCKGLCTFLNNDGESCGSCDVSTAITVSDDVFFYTLGYRFWANSATYGDEPIQKAAAAYGFGQPTGLDLPAEDQSDGQVDGPQLRLQQHKEDPSAFPYASYEAGDALETAFGQGETVITPLQLASAYATFANGGTRYAPQLAAAIVSPSGKVIRVFKPKVLGHVSLPSSTYNAIFQGLLGVVKDGGSTSSITGTAYSAFVGYPYAKLPLAGKTGTATTSNVQSAQPTALFVAFGPATGDTGAPQYCAAVVIPEAGYGAAAAAPVVRSVFQYLISHPLPKLDLRPSTSTG
jgi:penicillin-binding protein 2